MKKLKNFALVILCLGAITMIGACDKKVSSEKIVSRADQIAYLKAHEQKMTDYVKSQNPKIESVQFDWDSVQVGTIGNGTPQGGGEALTIDGKFNEIPNSNISLWVRIGENKLPMINTIELNDNLRSGGELYE